MIRFTRRTMLEGLAAGALAAPFASRVANAATQTFALVTINEQALFFNQLNDGARKAASKARRNRFRDRVAHRDLGICRCVSRKRKPATRCSRRMLSWATTRQRWLQPPN